MLLRCLCVKVGLRFYFPCLDLFVFALLNFVHLVISGQKTIMITIIILIRAQQPLFLFEKITLIVLAIIVFLMIHDPETQFGSFAVLGFTLLWTIGEGHMQFGCGY